MPASHTKSSGVSRVDANGAKAELEEWVATNRPDLLNQTLTRPFEIIPIRTQSTSISEKFQPQARTHAAGILGCSTDQVFFTNHIVMRYNKLDSPQRWVSAAHKGRAITILALGDLDSDKGLPGFGDPPEYSTLQSGEALHALADAPQHFKGRSIGWALVLSWTRSTYDAQSSPKTGS